MGVGIDLFQAPEHVAELFAVRLVFSLGALAIFALTFVPRVKDAPAALAAALALWIAVGLEVMVARTGGVSSAYWTGHGVLMMALGLMFLWTWPQMLGVCTSIVALHAAAMARQAPLFELPLATQLYFLINIAVIAVIGSFLSMRLRRREFEARAALEWRTEELREASGNLRETVDKLRELDRLKTQFFANVSHELRTPLTVVLALVEDLQDEPGLRGSVRERLDMLSRSARTLLRLINDLLDLAQLDAGKAVVRREAVDLAALIDATVAEFRPFAERRGIELAAEYEPLPAIGADPEKLETVLRNLVSNAVKFTPGGGRVTVRGRHDEAWAVLEVCDTGIGIRPEDQPVIFDRFTRVAGSTVTGVPGSGIGLALVKEVTALHGGEVALESRPGSGSTFRVRLPRAQPVASAPSIAKAQQLRPTPSSRVPRVPDAVTERPEGVGTPREAPVRERTVLVAEDDRELRTFLVDYLGQHFEVLAAVDGESALALARERVPDLIVADLGMPKLGGQELVRALKRSAQLAEIPVLLLTATRGPAAVVEGLQGGADDFIHKPFSPRELLARIRAQLRVRDLNRQLVHSQRMVLLGTLTAGLAHEVRNPINAIVNGLPLIARALPESGERQATAREMVSIVEDATRRIQRIVDDLLGFSRRDLARATSWRPNDGVRAALELLRHRLENRTVELSLDFAGEVPGFPSRLDQVVVNLIDNALRATRADGTLRLRTEPRETGVAIVVQDDGPGIPSEVLPRIFDPFFTTRAVGDGTGLGLHLSRQIVEGHGGRLSAASVPGQGATITLWLPCVEPT